jgi:hypothetical protein
MKKVLLTAMFAGLTSVAMAVPLCSGPTPDITSFNALGGCTASNLLFSNFTFTPTGGAGPTAALSSLVFTPGNVRLNINPNQANSTVAQESILTFTVSGLDASALIIGASSSTAGNPGSTLRQVVCAGSIDTLGNCTGTLLQDVTNGGGGVTPTQFFAGQSTVNVWRDAKTPLGTTMTGTTTDFQSTPEPVAFVLMGSGLVGLALFRKRRKS